VETLHDHEDETPVVEERVHVWNEVAVFTRACVSLTAPGAGALRMNPTELKMRGSFALRVMATPDRL
jgi:hypothetical protein